MFDTNILLSHVICPSLCRYGLVLTKKIASACIDNTSSFVQQCHAPAVTIFKTTKINFEGLFRLSTKIRPHENYPPYGTCTDDMATFTTLAEFAQCRVLSLANFFSSDVAIQ